MKTPLVVATLVASTALGISEIQEVVSTIETPLSQSLTALYSKLPAAGDGIDEAVARMLYVPGQCICP